jgi:chromosomal replication initiator protein
MRSTWDEIKNQIQSELPKNSFSLWINTISFLAKKDKTVELGCPNKFSRNWVMENYFDLIQDKLHKAGALHVDLVLQPNIPERKSPVPYCTPYNEQLMLPNIPGGRRNGKGRLNSSFTFDRFVVGRSNEFAYSASKALANGDSWNYHSLLMLANTGLGKSHLSQAVGHAILQENPRLRVFYVTAEDFTNEMISSLKNSRIDEFKNKYRRLCDVLLLEEIHFLSGKEKIQVELGYTLDTLANDNKKILFTSSIPPNDIPRMSKGLSSRICSGLFTTISKPDYDTRVKILTKKASDENIAVSEEIIHFLANRLKRDIRQMESALKYIAAKSKLLKAKIDLDLAKDVVACLVSGESSIMPEDIINLVSKYYKVDPEMLRSKSRKKVYAYPRNIYVFLCRRHTDETIANIAQTINRSHSTILYASEIVEHKIKTDQKMRHQIDFLSKKLMNMKG